MEEQSVKQCCATFYGSDFARMLLGDSFHPGGTRLTERLGELLALTSQSQVLDVASGRGTSAFHLAKTFGCKVTGIDLSEENVRRSVFNSAMPSGCRLAMKLLMRSSASAPSAHSPASRLPRRSFIASSNLADNWDSAT